MADTLIELVKFVGLLGGFVGLATGSFIIYDRLVRFRPIAFLFPADYKTNIRFKNVAAETIIIDRITIKPPLLFVRRANDLKPPNTDRAETWYGSKDPDADRVFVIIKPMEERTFMLSGVSADFDHAPADQVFTIKCRWRNTRKPFPIARHVRIKTTARDVRELRDASLANKV
jgi:hypothetical protein